MIVEDLLRLEVRCFHHCSLKYRILCFKIPLKCPLCNELLMNDQVLFKIPPYVIPAPISFKKINQYQFDLPSFSLLIQPTSGDYAKLLINTRGDLHIGVTNSKQEAFDFSFYGLQRNSPRWTFLIPSIIIPLNDYLNEYAREKWDHFIEEEWLARLEKWSTRNYDENKNNCFDFLILFLNKFFKNNELKKDHIVNGYIQPEYEKFLSYLKLLLKINELEVITETF
jgi:hypothetical protein